MNIFTRAYHTLKSWTGRGNASTATHKRGFDAARFNRLSMDWALAPTSTRSELRQGLRAIRARSRDLARNNEYFKKFLKLCQTNIIGPRGIQLQVRSQSGGDALMAELDGTLDKIVERRFWDWGKAQYASASGKLSWLDIQRVFVSTLARDGEVLMRIIRTGKRANPFGLTLQFIDVNWLDETHNALLENGHRIIMGVEVNQYDKPMAYWLTPPTDETTYPGAMGSGTDPRNRTRVPADEIIHAYFADDENQTRGLPWGHAIMTGLKMLGGYQEAELVAARVAACKMGFLKPPDDQAYEGNTALRFDQVEPGVWQELPAGWNVQEYSPDHPNTNYANFVKGVLQGIAAGMGVSYASLTGDLSEANYSSARIGLLEERDNWRKYQTFVADHLCERVYQAWREAAFLTGALEITLDQYKQIDAPLWQARGWAWVDPIKDIQANILAINHGLATRTQTLAEQGGDFTETVELLAQEKTTLEKHGIELAQPEGSAAKPAKEGAPEN